MRPVYYAPGKKNPHLPHDALELGSASPVDAVDEEIISRDAEILVSNVMSEERKNPTVAKQPSKTRRSNWTYQPTTEPRRVRTQLILDDDARVQPRRVVSAKTKPILHEETQREDKTQRQDKVNGSERKPSAQNLSDAPAAVEMTLNMRSKIWVSLAIITVSLLWIWPGLALVLALISVLAVLVPSYLLNMAAKSRWMVKAWTWYARKRPARADRLRIVADRFAMRFDFILDLLPSSWGAHLELPDYSTPIRTTQH